MRNQSLCIFTYLIKSEFQTWRKKVFGKIDSDKIRFLNKIEEPWYSGELYKEHWIACDQIIMAVFLDDSCVVKQQKYWVNLSLFSIWCFLRLLSTK